MSDSNQFVDRGRERELLELVIEIISLEDLALISGELVDKPYLRPLWNELVATAFGE